MAIRVLQQYFRNENCEAKMLKLPEAATGEAKNTGMRRILCCSGMGFIQNR